MFSQYFNVCIYDLRGHGLSGGKRAYVESFSEFTDDLEEMISYLTREYEHFFYFTLPLTHHAFQIVTFFLSWIAQISSPSEFEID